MMEFDDLFSTHAMSADQPGRIISTGPTDTGAADQRDSEIGPQDHGPGVDPIASARPAADVGRIEEILSQAARPISECQSTRSRIEKFQCPNGAGDILHRSQ